MSASDDCGSVSVSANGGRSDRGQVKANRQGRTMSRADLDLARTAFEQRWRSARRRLASELGIEERRSGWLTLLLAAAVGLATAAAIKKGRRRPRLPSASD